jgi:hypothetical protein
MLKHLHLKVKSIGGPDGFHSIFFKKDVHCGYVNLSLLFFNRASITAVSLLSSCKPLLLLCESDPFNYGPISLTFIMCKFMSV